MPVLIVSFKVERAWLTFDEDENRLMLLEAADEFMEVEVENGYQENQDHWFIAGLQPSVTEIRSRISDLEIEEGTPVYYIPLKTTTKWIWKQFIDAMGITLDEIKYQTYIAPEDDEYGAPINSIGSWIPGSGKSYCLRMNIDDLYRDLEMNQEVISQFRRVLSDFGLPDFSTPRGSRKFELSPIEKQFLIAWRNSPKNTYNQQLKSQHPVIARGSNYRLDFAIPELKVGIELDGHASHSSTDAIAHDRKRQRDLEAAGWHIIRFGGKEVYDNAYACAREVIQILRRMRAQ